MIDAGAPHFTNMFVALRNGEADIPKLERDLEHITGTPTNTINFVGEARQARTPPSSRRGGLWLFALAVLLGGGTLVGQALARAVTARADDLETLQAMGAAAVSSRPAWCFPPS